MTSLRSALECLHDGAGHEDVDRGEEASVRETVGVVGEIAHVDGRIDCGSAFQSKIAGGDVQLEVGS